MMENGPWAKVWFSEKILLGRPGNFAVKISINKLSIQLRAESQDKV